jgi:homoserine kinase type II
MVIYTPLTNQEIAEFVEIYALGKVLNYMPLEGGSTNSNYVIESSYGKYILTISDDKTFQQAESFVNLICHLEKYDFPTSKLIRDKNNKYINNYQGKPVFLKQYLTGSIVEEAGDQMLLQIGEMMAQLHHIPVLKGLPDYCLYGIKYFSELITDKRLKDPYIQWLEKMNTFLLENMSSELPRGLVHGDIFADNIIQDNDNFVAIIDFEEAAYLPFVFDIGMAIIGTCAENDVISLAKVKLLIEGYQEKRILSQLEKDNIRIFTIYGAVATSFWRYRQFNILFPNKIRSKRYQQMVKLADSLYKMDNIEFLRKVTP